MDVDVVKEILSRLPVRSLLRFKCVSKFWMTLISDPYFKMKHLNHVRNDNNSQKILVNQWYSHIDNASLYCSSLSSVQQIEHEHVKKLDSPCNDKPWRYSLYCCCNGMALMGLFNYHDKHFQLLLWNPSTRESILLPYPKILPKDYCTWGLGYDSASDDTIDAPMIRLCYESENDTIDAPMIVAHFRNVDLELCLQMKLDI
ncbi:hypothetical protein R3W88_018956 [Solanum pinnatisectum]|uniref:F-box domain-containing protein n=1 Tax=Solanum pinnatisectum TaxID=50273 RepID=A0AAV9KIA1_9SOLN|nr:hypothetical protein R3W88_018956 [Solanum pinnatisectum]